MVNPALKNPQVIDCATPEPLPTFVFGAFTGSQTVHARVLQHRLVDAYRDVGSNDLLPLRRAAVIAAMAAGLWLALGIVGWLLLR